MIERSGLHVRRNETVTIFSFLIGIASSTFVLAVCRVALSTTWWKSPEMPLVCGLLVLRESMSSTAGLLVDAANRLQIVDMPRWRRSQSGSFIGMG